jgi:hypothetical protein
MNTDKQQIAIAEACGNKPHTPSALGVPRWIMSDCEAGEISVIYRDELPDYLGDLNACHEMEKVLFAKNDWRLIRAYFFWLSPNLHSDDALDGDDWKLCHATAAQRAEAFLRTIGKWEGAK